MIIYYDVLYHDGRSLMNVRHSERFKLLQQLVTCEAGIAELVHREVIDFSQSLGVSSLRKAFARTIVGRGEGLVLKYDEPYILVDEAGSVKSGRCIKLKKEYIGSFGDVGDFAVVGAGFNSVKAKEYSLPQLKWTHFYVGCLNNKEEVKRWKASPEFTVVNVVELSPALLQSFISYANLSTVPIALNLATKLHLAPGIESSAALSVAFTNPAVFDLRCFSFDKVGNTGFWSLRFPSVTKIHFDRDWTDAVTFEELQNMAKEATTCSDIDDSQENLAWIARLEGADPRGIAVDAVSQLTATTMPSPSPVKASQASSRFTNGDSQEPSPTTRRVPRDSVPSMMPRRSLGPADLISPPTSSDPKQSEPMKLKRTGTPNPEAANFKRVKWPVSQDNLKLNCPELLTHRSPLQELSQASTNSSIKSSQTITTQIIPETQVEIVVEENVSERMETRPTHSPCTFAGTNCHLKDTVVIASSKALAASHEIASLLQIHGIFNEPPDIDVWCRQEQAALLPSRKAPAMLLVDTIGQKSQTEALLAKLYRIRSISHKNNGNLIPVYDWRVLRNINTMEDKRVTRKSYDGFQDPWRRWYCGEI